MFCEYLIAARVLRAFGLISEVHDLERNIPYMGSEGRQNHPFNHYNTPIARMARQFYRYRYRVQAIYG